MKEKIRIIHDINELLESFDQKPLNTGDFDILYDMDIDELMRAEIELRTRLESILVTKN